MKHLFEPTSVALVGVSANPAKLSYLLMRNVAEAHPRVKMYPVSRSSGEIMGYPTYPDLKSLPSPPDLVLISVSRDRVRSLMEEAASVGAGAAVILSSGFGETEDPAGRLLEADILRIAKSSGMRVMGPNCLGVFNSGVGLNCTYFVERPLRKGNISVASQSGAYGGLLVHELNSRGIGLAKFASIGNQIDVLHQEVVTYFLEDEETEVIGLVVEGIKRGSEFLEALRQATAHKPVVIFKVGRTQRGKRAAISHTGAIAGDFQVAEAAFRQVGALLAESTDQFHDYLLGLSCNCRRLPRDDSVAVMTISGGPSVAATDRCEELDLRLPDLHEETVKKLRQLLPSFAAIGNPVDMTVATPKENFVPAVEAVVSHESISGCIAINWGFDEPAFAHAFVEAAAHFSKPVVACAVANPKVQEIFRANGVLVTSSPERAVSAYHGLVQHALCRRTQGEPDGESLNPSRVLYSLSPDVPRLLDEVTSKNVLSEYGIQTCREILVENESDLVEKARLLGYPVTLKAVVQGEAHKTEKGGVALNLANDHELWAAAAEMTQNVGCGFPFVVQEFVHSGTEILIGTRRDPTFGLVVVFGLGGIFAELLDDMALRVYPFSHAEAVRMVQEIRCFPLLQGYRRSVPTDIEALADLIMQVARIAQANENIADIDINPVMVRGSNFTVVDALIVLRDSGTATDSIKDSL